MGVLAGRWQAGWGVWGGVGWGRGLGGEGRRLGVLGRVSERLPLFDLPALWSSVSLHIAHARTNAAPLRGLLCGRKASTDRTEVLPCQHTDTRTEMRTHAPMQNLLRGRKAETDKIEVAGVDESKLWEAARNMAGFSGGWYTEAKCVEERGEGETFMCVRARAMRDVRDVRECVKGWG